MKTAAIDPQEAWRVYRQADCIHDRQAVDAALDRLSVRVTNRLRKLNPLLICAMTGGVVTFGRLLPRLGFPLQIDYAHVGRYDNNLSGGELTWHFRPATALRGRHVLLVDDVLDQGHTLLALQTYCREQDAAAVEALVLVEKELRRTVAVSADYVGLAAPDRYLFGCGMDYKGYLRNLPGIYAVAES